jgi:hypothetical protein
MKTDEGRLRQIQRQIYSSLDKSRAATADTERLRQRQRSRDRFINWDAYIDSQCGEREWNMYSTYTPQYMGLVSAMEPKQAGCIKYSDGCTYGQCQAVSASAKNKEVFPTFV